MTSRLVLCWVLAVGCSGDKDTDTDTGIDSDTDTDTDTDSDTDTDVEPTCADASSVPPAVEEFVDLFFEKVCWIWDHGCGDGGDCPGGAPGPVPPRCVYDASLACACLDAPGFCGGSGANGIPVLEPSCQLVLICPPGGSGSTTGTTTDTGVPKSIDSGAR